jgi:hypothetical protein
LQPLKVKNRLDLLTFKWHAIYFWKVLDKGYNFALNITSIRGLHKTLRVFKVAKVPILKILELPGQNDI